MIRMLLTTALFALAGWGAIEYVARSFEGVTIDDASFAQFGVLKSNLTTVQLEEFEDQYKTERYVVAVKSIVAVVASGSFAINMFGMSTFMGLRPWRAAMTVTPFIAMSLLVFVMFDVFEETRVPPTVFVCFTSVAGSSSVGILLFMFLGDDRNSLNKTAGIRAAARLLQGKKAVEEQQAEESKKMPLGERIVLVMKMSAPMMFTSLVLSIMSLGIFGAYRAAEHIVLKVAISVLAQVVKVAGNKGNIILCTAIADVADPWIIDANIFIYE
jgi:hypothetical protein